MSQSNIKIILLLLSVMMVGGVYLYVYQPNVKDTKVIETENEELEARLKDLQEKEKNREMYETQIVEYQEGVDEVIAYFPATLDQEISVMFIKGVEEVHDG